ncbi:MAG: hypothetical protein CME62_03690 [Halobacteriovoraceae bacterium]|nr:hypothetical protein [Halobacteriovoraceae bacterium]|tara:strand:+ start:5668 stop:6309 length:642 start_codon:yes stop_codon:yes gene_type:complete
MSITITGVTSENTIQTIKSYHLNSIGFDLRPKSFNFIQEHKIKSILTQFKGLNVSLLFENDKDFVINHFYQDLKSLSHQFYVEFTGQEKVAELEKLNIPYFWHYHSEEKISSLASTKNLKKIILTHSVLREFQQTGELFGFLQLFADINSKIKFELLLDWDTEIMLSMFEYFEFHGIQFEINSKVERSYQNVNQTLLSDQLSYYLHLFKKEEE